MRAGDRVSNRPSLNPEARIHLYIFSENSNVNRMVSNSFKLLASCTSPKLNTISPRTRHFLVWEVGCTMYKGNTMFSVRREYGFPTCLSV